MPRNRRPPELTCWKQDLLAALGVLIYLGLGLVVVQVWSDLSQHADAFAGAALTVLR